MLSLQNTRLITVNTVTKAVTKILFFELKYFKLYKKKKKKRTIWVRNRMQRKRDTHTIFKELYNEDPLEYKSVMRLTPSQVEIKACGLVGEGELASKNKKCCSNWHASH